MMATCSTAMDAVRAALWRWDGLARLWPGYGHGFFDASVSRETSREDLPTRHSQPDFMQTAGAVVGPGEGFLRARDLFPHQKRT